MPTSMSAGSCAAGHESSKDASGDWVTAGKPAAALNGTAIAVAERPARTAAAVVERSDAGEQGIPFPLAALQPDEIREYCKQSAASVPCPVELVAIPLLGAAGALVRRSRVLRLKLGWCEPGADFFLVIARPGDGKTPGMARGLHGINAIQRRLAAEHQVAEKRFRQAVATWEATPKAERGPQPEAPRFPSVVVHDITDEALLLELSHSSGLLQVDDEASGAAGARNQYKATGKGRQDQNERIAWSGSPLKADRKGTGTIYVAHPVLAQYHAVQPDRLDAIHPSGRDDGTMDRKLVSNPTPVPFRWTSEVVSRELERFVEERFEAIFALEPDEDEYGAAQPREVCFSEAASQLWVAWFDAHAAEMAAEDFDARLRGPWAKFPIHLARLALTLHVLRDPSCPSELRAEVLGSAIELVTYFKAQARALQPLLGRERRDGQALRLLKALKGAGAAGLGQREILHDVFNRNVSAEQISRWLAELAEQNLVRRETRQGEAGRPATVWFAV